jgi:hypothetical protein
VAATSSPEAEDSRSGQRGPGKENEAEGAICLDYKAINDQNPRER